MACSGQSGYNGPTVRRQGADGAPANGTRDAMADIKVLSEIAGKVWLVETKPGARVSEGDTLVEIGRAHV